MHVTAASEHKMQAQMPQRIPNIIKDCERFSLLLARCKSIAGYMYSKVPCDDPKKHVHDH